MEIKTLMALAKPSPSLASTQSTRFLKALEEALSPDFNKARDHTFLHASQVKDYCPRRNVLEAVYEISPEPFDPSLQIRFIFEIGHILHRHVQEELFGRRVPILRGQWVCSACGESRGGQDKNTAAIYPEELGCDSSHSGRHIWSYVESHSVDLDHKLGGSIDGFLALDSGEIVGLEIKTISGPEFKKLKGIKPEHYHQAQVYMHLFDLNHQVFVYLSKAFHEPSSRMVKDGKIWKLGPFGQVMIQRDQNYINTLLAFREQEFSHTEAIKAGTESYPPCLTACKTLLSSKVKSCHVGSLCMELKDGGF